MPVGDGDVMRANVRRVRFGTVLLLCAVVMLILPSAAFAESWVNQYPFGTTHFQPSMVSVAVFGTTTIAKNSARITIDGVPQYTFLTQGTASGHWESTEYEVDTEWFITWTWVPDTGGATKATLKCYPPLLADGLHTVTATARQTNGVQLSTDTWTFYLAQPPTITNLVPAAGQKVTTATPVISAKITDNVGVTGVTATVNAVPVTVTGPVGGVYTLSSGALVDGPVTVAITAVDAAGNRITRTWAFTVSTIDQTCIVPACHGDVEFHGGTACTECHPDRITPHGYDPSAHDADYGAAAMAGTWTMALEPARTYAGVLVNPPYVYDFGCAACHAVNIYTEHAKPTSAPVNSSACADCHPSPRNTIAGSWNKQCATAGCHTVAGQEPHATTATLAKHAVAASVIATAPSGQGCSTSAGDGGFYRTPCHTTDLIQEHNRLIGGFETFPTESIATTLSVTCDECHQSAEFAALGGAWDGTCGDCHTASHAVVGSARYAEVRAQHQASRYYASGGSSGTGASIEGSNAIDAHGPVRTVNGVPYGCANGVCHQQFYREAGLSGVYPAGACSNCHGTNIAPLTPYDGTHMWASGSLDVYEPVTMNLTLTLATPLPAASALDFKTFYDIESGWDYGYVQVSTDGGSNWTSLASTITTNANPNGNNFGNGITGTSGGEWVDAHFDLSAYAGQTVKLRFRYMVDDYIYGDGWFVDALTVGPTGAPIFADDVETAKPEWAVTSTHAMMKWSR